MTSTKGLSAGFEFLDIEIIDHKKDTEVSNGKWKCDQCSLVFLSKEKLIEHKSKHIDTSEEALTCRYCNKTLSLSEDSKDCYANRKCNTCEYKCANCPLRFQRQSSLLNHEKTHKMFKKNKKSKFTTSKLKNMALKQKKSVKRENEDVTITPIKLKKMKTQISPIIPHTLTNDTVIDSNNCNYTGTNNNKSQETKTHSEKKQNMKTSTQGSANNSSQEHSINYKPFSCHICGDNFASGESLLEHIPSHGEDTSGFKCKHCGDKFDDIYKMQYHLATCPLAEDETNLVKNLASRLVKTPGGPPRRQGRPRKIKESPYNIPGTDKTSNINSEFELNNTNHSRPKRKKRNLAMSNLSFNEFVDSNCSEIDDNVHDETEEDPLNISDTLYESYEPVDEEKTKVHCCPFPRCDMKFSREKALLCHMRNHSDDFEDSYKCHKCDIPFDDIHSLRLHLNECTDIKEECLDKSSEPDFEEYTCTDKTYSSLHKKKGDFICSVCGKVYQSQEKLKRCLHITGAEPIPPCRLCGEHFDDENVLKKHFRLTHPMSYPYQCNICFAEFDTKAADSEHILSHVDRDNFECVICSLKLPTYKDLYFHYKHDHVTKKQNICKICNKIFPNKMLLLKHSSFHEGEDKHKCIFCQKKLSSNTSLSLHLKRHTNKKLYKCKICYRPFFEACDLVKHMLLHATMTNAKEQPLMCCLCDMLCKNKTMLSDHIKNSHFKGSIAILQCPICEDVLMNLNTMRSHIIKHSARISEKKMSDCENKWLNRTNDENIKRKRGRPKRGVQEETDRNSVGKTNKNMDSKNKDSTEVKDSFNTEVISSNVVYVNGNIDSNASVTKDNPKLQNTLIVENETNKQIRVNSNKDTIYESVGKRKSARGNKSSDTFGVVNHELHMRMNNNKKKTTKNTPNEFKAQASQKRDRTSNLRPMSFIKITSRNKSNYKPIKQFTNKKHTQHSLKGPDDAVDISQHAIKEELDENVGSKDQAYVMFADSRVKEENEELLINDVSAQPPIVKQQEYVNPGIREVKTFAPSHKLPTYNCPTCSRSFSSHEELYFHTTTHIL